MSDCESICDCGRQDCEGGCCEVESDCGCDLPPPFLSTQAPGLSESARLGLTDPPPSHGGRSEQAQSLKGGVEPASSIAGPPRPGINLRQKTPMPLENPCPQPGYFLVDSILKHKYKQCYTFLVRWQHYPIEDSTWEPIESFIQPNGFINEVFKAYCQQHKLERAFKQAIQQSNKAINNQ